MDLLQDVSQRIAQMQSGEQVIISAQALFISRADFHSMLAFLNKESKQGHFAIEGHGSSSWFELTSLTINKF